MDVWCFRMSCFKQCGLSKQRKSLVFPLRSVVIFLGGLALAWSAAKSQEPATSHGSWEQYKIQLTPQEIAWIKAHPTVRVGFDPAWPPFSFKDATGMPQGIDLDLLARLEDRLGLKFEPTPASDWEETEQKIFSGDVDMVTGLGRSENREKYLLFTSSYITTSLAVITREDAPFLTSLHNLKNVTLASPRGYVTTEKLIKDYPSLPLIQTANALEALTLVSGRKADVAVENLAAASYLIKSAHLPNLKIAGIADYHFDLCLAARKDWPELQSILQKGLDSISDAERRQMFDQWTAVEYFPHTNWPRVWKTGLTLLLITMALFGVFAWWNRRLAYELAERRKAERELKTAHDRLQELNREKDRFMSMAAHDLNSPLTAIIMKCSVAEMEENFSEASTHDFLSTIRNNALRMSHLITNLLNADKMEHGQMQLKSGLIDLSGVVSESMETLQPCAESKAIRLEFGGPAAPVQIKGDREATLQVMENLLSNAIKYTPYGKTVVVNLIAKDGKARVEVLDQGPGISDEERPRLFGKYVTLSARPTANEPSHGLGLSIAKTLVESMKGRIACESKEGEGALFVVEFNLAARVETPVA